MKKKAGAPTKYRKVYCELAEALLGQDLHLTHVAAHLRVSIDTIYEWQKQHPEFSDAIARGRAAGHAKFIDKVQEAAWNPLSCPVNNGMVGLLAVNKYKMVSNRSAAKDELKVEGNLSLADAVRRRHEKKK